MNEASKIMEEVLEDTDFKNLDTKFISNVTAKIENDIRKSKVYLMIRFQVGLGGEKVFYCRKNGFENFPRGWKW